MCNLLKPKSSNFSTVFCMLVVFLEALRKSINLNHLSSIRPHCIFHGRIYRFTQRLALTTVYGRIGNIVSQSRVWPSKSRWNHLKPPISNHGRASLGRSTPSDRHSWRGRGRSARPGGRGPGWICQSPPDLEGHKNWGFWIDFDGLELDLRLDFDGLRLDFDGLRLDQDFAFVAIENAALAATWPQTMHKSPAFRVRFTGPRLKEPRASHRRFHVFFFQVF